MNVKIQSLIFIAKYEEKNILKLYLIILNIYLNNLYR